MSIGILYKRNTGRKKKNNLQAQDIGKEQLLIRSCILCVQFGENLHALYVFFLWAVQSFILKLGQWSLLVPSAENKNIVRTFYL